MTMIMDSISTARQSMLLYDTKAEVLRPWKMSEIEYCQEKTRSPKNPEQKIIKRVIALEGDIVKTPETFPDS
ncbi:hypothetical protein E5288_WYG014410 [Bos mutus]|uniref:Uncharacterized protein n=1 Tax=Bos mutus TaxID=72004 RepID=A0A6B0R503_9CETA|nr:hypothetical protein [Bos mutus]